MKSSIKRYGFLFFLIVLIGTGTWLVWPSSTSPVKKKPDTKVSSALSESAELDRTESKKARGDYFFRLLRDPATNKIPRNIRARELQFAKGKPTKSQFINQYKSQDPTIQANDFNWNMAGPFDVGGRTRALAIEKYPSPDSDVIIAGGVSGGIWKSTDGGSTWEMKTDPNQNMSVTSLAQDPNNPDTWYYSSGEFIGSSASATGAPYFGSGIYKSTDNGETWNILSSTNETNKQYDSQFDFISRVAISPQTSTVFFSSNGFGVYRSTDGGQTFNGPVIGSERNQIFSDVTVASNGRVAAAISQASFGSGSAAHEPGIYISDSDGAQGSWTEVTPQSFPNQYQRSVLAFAPSNPDILYVLTHVEITDPNNTTQEDNRLHKINLNTGQSTDMSDNIPDFGGQVGAFWTQSGYDMEIAVKPDDENFILVGGTNLYRGRSGFTKSSYSDSDKDEYWIGGYSKENDISQYPNQHPDQHVIAFDPTDPNRMWTGHDGGLSVTEDITASSVSWTDKNNAYLTSQFYTIAIPPGANDDRLMGGTQDNGSPFFRFDNQQSQSTSTDISFGDGGYAYFSNSYLFVSQQNGRVIRYDAGSDGVPETSNFAFVHPSSATGQLFIQPYEVDPNDESIMYYPSTDENGTQDPSDDESIIYRNTEVNSITNTDGGGASQGWVALNSVDTPTGYSISALETSNTPSHILYYAGYSSNNKPVLRRLENANTADNGATDISISTAASGAYIHDIAINPVNAEEVLVVMSNYNITGIFHTTDGGQSWTAVEGNLTGSTSNPGPSIRSATIIPAEGGPVYLVGTSTGLYSTQNLNGNSTTWVQEASDKIGYAITESLDSRIANGDVAVGTHGQGAYLGAFQGNTNAPFITVAPTEARAGDKVTITANDFSFSSNSQENQVIFGQAEATILNTSDSQLEVEVPRNAQDPDDENNSVTVKVKTPRQSLSSSFQVLPPNDFTLSQNYPNPFNPSTTIPFDIPVQSEVTLTIFSINGQKVLEPLQQQTYNSGTYDVSVDLSNLASGVYIYRLYVQTSSGSDDALQTKKMTLIK